MSDVRACLAELAGNLRWTWSGEFEPFFREIDLDLWRRVNHNPTAFLAEVEETRIEARAGDPSYRENLQNACRSLREYLQENRHWASRHAPGLRLRPVAYFSAEFGLHESLSIYSGGLGVLAGDHLKSCSDLGVPIWGVTLLYRQGYVTQRIDAQGNQEESYVDLDLRRVPLEPILDLKGERASIQLQAPSGVFPVDLWRARVGRAHLLLLDGSRDPSNTHRRVFSLRLYGGDLKTRLMQEMILGMGGFRALLSVGVRPGVLHLNEGHSALAVLEAIAQAMEEEGLDYREAAEQVRARTVFTTHTPVAAGHDRFPPELISEYLGPLRERLKISEQELLGLGRVRPDDAGESFCMTVLALKLSNRANAVSSLHAHTSRKMWQPLWPGRSLSQIPIGHITNGVHVPTWIAPEMARFFQRHLGKNWLNSLSRPEPWEKICDVPLDEIWELQRRIKSDQLAFVQRRMQERDERLGESRPTPGLNPEALTIGVARRFVEYKRAALLFDEKERLARLLGDPQRPVQVLFAGKAHPHDQTGKAILRSIYQYSQQEPFYGHIFVLENHDINVGRHLVQGCDLWLNSPRRPLEACGTSGQKAVFNGTLNLSVLDGWWAQAYDGENGYAFGDGLTHRDTALHDRRDGIALLDVLEKEVIPDFFDRSRSGVPERWAARIRRAMATLCWRYNSDRMAIDYVKRCYLWASGSMTAEFLRPDPPD